MEKALFTVQGKPFFSIGGQTNNSTSGDEGRLEHAMKTVHGIGMNTIATPATWELLEQREGVYDFTQVDRMVDMARKYGLRLIILWFGTWKNGNSHYVPEWVKLDHDRLPGR